MKTLLVCLACLAALGGPASGAQAVGGSTPPEQRADPGVSQGNPPSRKGGGAGAGYSGPGDTTPSAPPTLPAPGPADPEGAGNPGGPQPPPTAPDGPPGGKTDDGAQGGLGRGRTSAASLLAQNR